jgi:NADPH-dependent glutamate synthase beta subunit-like oxidoreductase
MNPVRLETSVTDPNALVSVIFERNTLTGEAGQQRAIGTGAFETIPACLVLVSIGYKGVPIPGTEQWFDDDSGTFRNSRGRVDVGTTQLGGLYTSGWIKRGPSGIIGTNIADAKETVATILADLQDKPMMTLGSVNGIADVRELLKLRGVHVVDWNGYRRIELKEHAIRRSEHQPREKIVKLDDQLAVAIAK